MAIRSQPSPNLETIWLREWARTYEPCEGGFWFHSEDLCEHGLTLIDIRHAFKNSTVLSSTRLEDNRQRWLVLGDDCDGNQLTMSIIVVTEKTSVSLEQVEKYRSNAEQGKKEGNNGA